MTLVAKQGMWQVIEHLIKLGASPDSQDYEGNTALHVAFQRDQRKTRDVLIAYDANEQIENNKKLQPWELLT